MEELKFSSENEALQHLADLTGKKVKIARRPKAPTSGSGKVESFVVIDEDTEEEVDVIAEFDWTAEEPRSYDSPGYGATMEITSVKRKDNGEEIIDDLSDKQIEDLENAAAESIPTQEELDADYADYMYDKMKEGDL